MAHGLEVRVPVLDHKLAEFCARIPVGLKLHGRTEKFILRRALRGILPKSILDRRKRAFTSPSWWRRDRLPDFAAAEMNEGALRRKGLFEPAAVHELLARHRRGEANHTRQLDAILGIQLRHDLLQPSRLRAESRQTSRRPTPTAAR
jgi:asparagine synthase (glutamine-hydrolysing)